MSSIHIRNLLSYPALQKLYDDNDWGDLHVWVEPEQLAWMVFRLRVLPDNPEVFPHGKWALIQHLEVLLDKAALEDIAYAAAQRKTKG